MDKNSFMGEPLIQKINKLFYCIPQTLIPVYSVQ